VLLAPLCIESTPKLGQYQRLIDRQIVQPRDIAAERRLVMQIDVEAEKIGEIDVRYSVEGKLA
jgi:hypothetical protein